MFNTNVKETIILNNLRYDSDDMVLPNGIINNYHLLLRNVNTDGENSGTYKS